MRFTIQEIIRAIEKKIFLSTDEEQVCLDYALEKLYTKDLETTLELNPNHIAKIFFNNKITLVLDFVYKAWHTCAPDIIIKVISAYFGTPPESPNIETIITILGKK